mgnify:CR=1 FL=1
MSYTEQNFLEALRMLSAKKALRMLSTKKIVKIVNVNKLSISRVARALKCLTTI